MSPLKHARATGASGAVHAGGRCAAAEDSSLARALDEPVDLRPFDPAWSARFAAEAARLACLLPDRSRFEQIAHIGSTAVPGMMAKPVIDMLAAIADWRRIEQVLRDLRALGYHHDPGSPAQGTDRRWLMRHCDGRRTHHLHVVESGSAAWRDRMLFRDRLATDPLLRGTYLALKYRLVSRLAGRREDYTAGKASFILTAVSAPSRPPRPIRCAPDLSRLLKEVASREEARTPAPETASEYRRFGDWVAARDPGGAWVLESVASQARKTDAGNRPPTRIPRKVLDGPRSDPAQWEGFATLAAAAADLLGREGRHSSREDR